MPYFDLDELRGIPDPAERFDAAAKEFAPSDKRRQIGFDVADTLKEKGYAITHVAQAIGADAGLLSNCLNGRRPFALPVRCIVNLGSMYLNKSAHEIMFGESPPTLLPRHLAVAARAMKAADADTRDKISQTADDAFISEQAGKSLPERSAVEIEKIRIMELANDKYTHPVYALGENAAPQLKHGLKKFLNSPNSASLTLATLMFYALEAGTTLDYFIAEDYAALAAVAYQHRGRTVVISDRKTVRFISQYLRLSDEGQRDVLGKAYRLLFG